MDNGRLVAAVRRSKIKKAVLRSLKNTMTTAAKIAGKTDFRAGHITAALRDLEKQKAVCVINPHDKEPDIYQITDLGRKALNGLAVPETKKERKRRKIFRLSGKRRSIS